MVASGNIEESTETNCLLQAVASVTVSICTKSWVAILSETKVVNEPVCVCVCVCQPLGSESVNLLMDIVGYCFIRKPSGTRGSLFTRGTASK